MHKFPLKLIDGIPICCWDCERFLEDLRCKWRIIIPVKKMYCKKYIPISCMTEEEEELI